MDIQPSAIYLFVVKNPRSSTSDICYHFSTKFQKVMPQLEEMERRGTLLRQYAYPGRMSLWSVRR